MTDECLPLGAGQRTCAALGPPLLGDAAHPVILDNTNVRRVVLEWMATTLFAKGAKEVIAWHHADTTCRCWATALRT
jgi:hypothetical protein